MTETQLNTLDNIRAFIAAHRRPPMVRELMQIEGLKSTAGMYNRLQALVRDGYLRKLDDPNGRYVPVDHSAALDLRGCSTEALQAELTRRRALMAGITSMGRSS